MGGFAIPDFLKTYRRNKQYLFLGLRLTRDTERMVMSDMISAAGVPFGYALIAEPTAKERRFCQNKGIDIVETDIDELLQAAGFATSEPLEAAAGVGC